MTLTALEATPRPAVGWHLPQAARLILGQALVFAGSLIVASAVIFFSLEVLPGDQASVIGGVDATPAQLAQLRVELGLDRPAWVRYLEWVTGAVRGDLGVSALDNVPVAASIAEKMQVTLPLCLLALGISVVVALPIGLVAAVGSHRGYGQAINAATQLGVALPSFIVGLLLARIVALEWGLFPVQGFPADRWAEPLDALRSLILPALTLAIPQTAVLVRFVRSATLDILDRDWVRTARSQGWRLPVILIRQGLRNTALPLISVVALEVAGLITGAVVVERVFSLPGIGQMLLADVGNRDLNKVQGTLLVLTGVIMIMTMLLDLLYRLVDPRLGARR